MKNQPEPVCNAAPGSRLASCGEPERQKQGKGSAWRKVAAGAILATGFCWVVFLFAVTLTDEDVAGRDYIEYWAAGRQVLQHANPYDASAILRLEQSAGPGRTAPELSASPPLVLLIDLPLALFSARTGLILWFAVLLFSFSVSLWGLWMLQGKPNSLLYLLGFLFAPALACLQCGQISILLLLSVVCFLYFVASRPWLAGVVLVPLALKPHLFLPFAAALLCWVFSRRAYSLLGGFFVAAAACLAAVFYLDPQAWPQYLQTMGPHGVVNDFVPTLSVALQRLISIRMVWLRFLPDAAACLWTIWYWRRRRNRWQWTHEGMVVLLVSSLCAPYGFFYDDSVLLAAVWIGFFQARQSGRSLWPIAIGGAAALVECLRFVPVTSLYYLWTTPFWLCWYVYATWNLQNRPFSDRNLTVATG